MLNSHLVAAMKALCVSEIPDVLGKSEKNSYFDLHKQSQLLILLYKYIWTFRNAKRYIKAFFHLLLRLPQAKLN